MNQYIEYHNDVLIPVQIVEITFYEKEETTLNAFQSFILEAMSSEKSLNQIVQATLLTKNVIESEIIQMINQKLLIREANNIILSDLSKKIQMISKSVMNLNKELKKICINLITGEIYPFNEDSIILDKDEELFMYPKITERDIDGISLEENTTFFENYMESFSKMEKSDIKTVFDSVFIEFKTVGKNKYIKKTLYQIPCAIGCAISETQKEESITVRGLMYQVNYQVESDIINHYKSIILQLIAINESDHSLLSEKGVYLLEQYKIYQNLISKELVCFYDTISGQFHFDKPKIKQSKNLRYNFRLPILHDFSDDVKNNITKELRNHYCIPETFTINEVTCNKEYYYINCNLSDLWREEHDEF